MLVRVMREEAEGGGSAFPGELCLPKEVPSKEGLVDRATFKQCLVLAAREPFPRDYRGKRSHGLGGLGAGAGRP